jgi:hypothetical protein
MRDASKTGVVFGGLRIGTGTVVVLGLVVLALAVGVVAWPRPRDVSAGRFPLASEPVIGPAPSCAYDVSSAVEPTVALLDDPRAAREAEACVDLLLPVVARGGGVIEEPHPFWPGARFVLSVEADLVTGSTSAIDATGLSGPTRLYREGEGVQTIVVSFNPEWRDGASDAQLERALLRECVHVGQHLLRMGALAGEAGVPPECLAGANQQAVVHARQAGRRAEPLAYAVVMLDARRRGVPAGPLLDVFRGLFPVEETLDEVVASTAYGRWREAVRAMVSGARSPSYATTRTASTSPTSPTGTCAARRSTTHGARWRPRW